jgi:hypothetical protein
MRNLFLTALLAGSTSVSLLAAAGSASAQVTVYTSQSAFDSAVSDVSTAGFMTDGNLDVESNPVTLDGFTFTSGVTAADVGAGGSPIIFLIPAASTPTYGTDFLSFQNTQTGILGQISTGGTDAFGFTYGSYVSTGDAATLTLSTGDSYTITPTSTAQFIGFTNDTPITSVSLDYPSGYSLDIVSVASAAPEPSAWLLLIAGVGGIGLGLRRTNKSGDLRPVSA